MTFSLAGVLAGSLAMGTAGILRGFTGFGTALAGVPLLSLVFAPRLAVPTIMPLQIATGLQNLHADGRHVEWRTLLRLLPGAVVGLVPGLWLLLWLELWRQGWSPWLLCGLQLATMIVQGAVANRLYLGRFTALLPASGGDERTEEQLEALRALGYVQ